MTSLLIFILSMIIFYLVGAIPTAYLLAKRIKGIDIRSHGSGNVGATNAVRVMGKKIGYTVFLIDFLKGLLPIYLYRLTITKFINLDSALHDLSMVLSISLIFGHVFNPFLGFKGGKGVATGAGTLYAHSWLLGLISTAIWVLVFFATKVVSVASILTMIFISIACWFVGSLSLVSRIVICGLALTIVWLHRTNIDRLLKGKEQSFKK